MRALERSVMRLAALALATTAVGCGASPTSTPLAMAAPITAPSTPRVVPRGRFSAAEELTIRNFERSAPSVTYITTLAVRADPFHRNVLTLPAGTGSGIVWDEDGHIVTNFHVIRRADAARVTLADGSVWPARLVGTYAARDVAVLRIEAARERLQPLPIGSSGDLRVGQYVSAIGNPFGLDHTLSTGVISGLDREILSLNRRPIRGVIQTDAAINPGNSGGPLLDSSGRLIGVNTAIHSPTGASAGIGFAVPIDTVARIVTQLIEHGRVIHPGLGLRIDESGVARRLGLPGVLVTHVTPSSDASRVGVNPLRRDPRTGALVVGDTLVALDGERIRTALDLYRLLDGRAIGARARLTLFRDGERVTVDVRLRAETEE